jgi:translation initiation factor eIF-2B subunit epsilon
VELLLTLEEFCGTEGVFEADSSGTAFAPLFANLLQLLYDGEVVEEAAITSWAAEKEHADESEKLFLQKVRHRGCCGGGGGGGCVFNQGIASM